MSFEDLFKVPESEWELAKYPAVYRMYPGDVPLREIATLIGLGHPVSHVSPNVENFS